MFLNIFFYNFSSRFFFQFLFTDNFIKNSGAKHYSSEFSENIRKFYFIFFYGKHVFFFLNFFIDNFIKINREKDYSI